MRLISAVLLVALVGCNPKLVRVAPYRDDARDGVVYALPRTVLKVAVTYTIREETQLEHGVVVKELAPVVSVEKPVVIEPITTADQANVFVLSGEDANASWLLETNFGFKVGENGILLGADVEGKDRSIEATQQIVTAALQAAKLLAVAGPGDADRTKAIRDRIAGIYARVAALPPNAPKRLETLEQLRKELDVLLAFAATYSTTNTTRKTEREVSHVVLLDPATDCKASRDGTVCTIQPQIAPTVRAAAMPSVEVHLLVTDRDAAAATVPFFPSQDAPARTGIVYRVARPVMTTVVVAQDGVRREVSRSVVLLPQYGRYAVAPLVAKRGGRVKTVASFDASGMREYKVEAGSVADQAVTKLGESLESVQKGIVAVRYDLEIDALKKQKELNDARAALRPTTTPEKTPEQLQLEALQRETEYTRALLDLEKLKKDLADLRRSAVQ